MSYKKSYFGLFVACLLFVVFLAGRVFAAEEIIRSDHSTIKIITASYNVSGDVRLALEFEMEKDWKIYWRTAGDVGFPVDVKFGGSENVKSHEIFWPYPKRHIDKIENFTSESYIYEKKAIFPVELKAVDPSKPVKLNLNINYGICKEICIASSVNHIVNIWPNYQSKAALKQIDSAMKLVPKSNGENNLIVNDVKFAVDKEKGESYLVVSAFGDKVNITDLFVEISSDILASKLVIAEGELGNKIFHMPISFLTNKQNLDGEEIILTLVGGNRAVEHIVAGSDVEKIDFAKSNMPYPFSASISIFIAIIFGFIGGIILNIMPCVLPVLSIKIMGVIKYGGSCSINVKQIFFVTALGIIFSFLVLAVSIILFKEAGFILGWGFHFQEPIFITILLAIVTIFALNMWGLFEFKVPSFICSKAAEDRCNAGLTKHFLSGCLATVLATPCTAPFLGTAVGFALAGSSPDIIMVFTAMGVGMSLPYLIFAIFPNLVCKLPKPGSWMIRVKKILALMLFATAIWLAWILNNQLNNSADGQEVKDVWQKFEQQQISEYVNNGKIVFVDVTADWCLTCKVNKYFVLDDSDIVEILASDRVIAMRADWTNRNEQIASYLKSHGRAGIPFNIIYSKNHPQGIILSELLSEKSVKQAFIKSGY